MKANTLCINSIYIHALVIIGILTAITYLTYLIFITLKLWISKIKKNRTCVEPITPHSNKLQEKGNSRPQEIVITVTSPSVHDFNQNTKAVRRSENPGVPVLFGGHNLPPLVEKGLTALPKSGGTMAPPAPPGTPGLNTEVNDYNKTTQGQKLQASEPAKSIAQSKNCQINSNHLHGKEEFRKQPRFHNSSFRELDVVKLSDLGGIHILRKQSYVSYDGNPLEFENKYH